MAKYVSLLDYHHFFLEKDKCEAGYIDEILNDVILNNVLFLSDRELSAVLNKLEQYLVEIKEKYRGKEDWAKNFSHPNMHIIKNICANIRDMTSEEYDAWLREKVPQAITHSSTKEISIGKIFPVRVPPAYVKFGGFSIAGDVKQYFPDYKPEKKDDEQDKFDIITPDDTTYKAHRSQESRVKIDEGKKCFIRLGVKENDKLKIEILEPFKRYRIIEVIHQSLNSKIVE